MRIRFLYPQQNEMQVVNLPNLEYLPLFYLFPKELLISKCPSLVDMPRSVHGIFTQVKWAKILASDFFLQAVCVASSSFLSFSRLFKQIPGISRRNEMNGGQPSPACQVCVYFQQAQRNEWWAGRLRAD